MKNWKHISTAKKIDGKILWLYKDNRPTGGKYVFEGSWHSDRKCWVSWDGSDAPWCIEATHWQPFHKPKPPK